MKSVKSSNKTTLLQLFGSKQYILLIALFIATLNAFSNSSNIATTKGKTQIDFVLTVEDPSSHSVQVTLNYGGANTAHTTFKMPVWTPGYYQIMNYADQVSEFKVIDKAGNDIKWEKTASNTWEVNNQKAKSFTITYKVKDKRAFVASNIVEEERTYLSPAGIFIFPVGELTQASTLTIKPYKTWSTIATGLEPIKGASNKYSASNFDILYDSPILMGSKLETLPVFYVKGIPHYFVGYNMGDFDKVQFIKDLSQIVESAANIIGAIPYTHYTFLAIGPGGGGIEHLNSASISFSGKGLATQAGRIKMYSFLAHEYFHHYNVKRIRPIELGPFDYDKGSPTKMLWVSEGLSVYYEYLVLRKAGIMSEDELLKAIGNDIAKFENKPGKLYQSLTEASYNTWSDGPFGRTGDEVNKTISYYEKGPVVGAILDFAIRDASNNKKSLNDVMRSLYYEYYLNKKRGFTESEFQATCEKMAGAPLNEVFEYAATVKPLNYPKYFSLAGLRVDSTYTVQQQSEINAKALNIRSAWFKQD